MGAIDVGPGAGAYTASTGGQSDTWIDTQNPANASGIIDTVEVYPAANIPSLHVGIFYLVSGTTYKCRAAVDLGSADAGAKRTFTGLSLAIQTGDLIGCWFGDGGSFRLETTGGLRSIRSNDGTNHLVVDDETDYATGYDDYRMAIYGTGEEPLPVGGSGPADVLVKNALI